MAEVLMLTPDEVAIRKDAEKWQDIATAEGVWDRRAEETLWLLSEIDRLRVIEAEYEAVIQQQGAVRSDGDEPMGISGPFTIELSGDFDEVWSHMFADDEGFIRIRLEPESGPVTNSDHTEGV